MKRFLLPVVMMFVLVSDSVYADFVNLPFVTEEQQAHTAFSAACLSFYDGLCQSAFCHYIWIYFRTVI